MTDTVQYYVLPINPEPWAIGPLSVIRRGGKMVPVVGRNAQLHAYKEAILEQLKDQIGDVAKIPGRIELRLFFWRRRDEYTTPQARTHRKHEADLTNLVKATEDALQGFFFDNDKDVVEQHNYLMEQSGIIEPRIVVGVAAARFPFDNSVLPEHVWNKISELYDQDLFGG